MLEKALTGSKRYWTWIGFLLAIMAGGGLAFLYQFIVGLGVTGLSRDIPWGFYIAQFTFLVGVAASAVMVVIPYYLHDYKLFGKMAVLGEFVAVAAVSMCMGFIVADMGQPTKVMNIFFHPNFSSLMVFDTLVCFGYLALNVLISIITFGAERRGMAPPKWIKPFIYLSIPWAVSIHTVTAFLYNGLAARPFWMSAILAPRFLASAFAAGPSLLIILCLILRKVADYDVGEKAIKKLAIIVTYAMITNVFFVGLEIFTAIYSQMPHHLHPFQYLFFGYEGHNNLVPWMWASVVLAIGSLVLLINPTFRNNLNTLAVACGMVFFSLWIDKGMCMVITGFVPNPMNRVTEYTPTGPEIMITLAVWAMGFLIITGLYKIASTVRKEEGTEPMH